MTLSTGILVMIALTVGGTLAAAVLYAVLTRGRNWSQELFSVRVLPFVLVGLAVGLTTFWIGLTGKEAADESLRLAVADIETDCDDELSLLLHADATVFADAFAVSNRLTAADLRRISEYLCIDEATFYDKDGRVVCTTDPGLKEGDAPFHWDNEEMRPYRDLLTGRRKIVRQRFRPNVAAPERIMKYFALALPRGGVVQIGYLWETFEREFKRFFEPQFEYREVCESGFCLVFDGNNRLVLDAVGHPDVKGLSAAEVGLTPEDLATPLGQVFRANLFGTPCRCMFYEDRISDRRILAAMPLSEGQESVLLLACGVAVVFFAVFLFFRLVLRKLRLQQAKIDALRAEQERRRAADMELARVIQLAELRTDGTEGDGYRLATLMKPARTVGGDFYDYYELPDGRLVVTVADVSGKGIPAAFFMMKARMTLKSCVCSTVTPVRAADTEVGPPGGGTRSVASGLVPGGGTRSVASGLADAVAKANARLSANNPADMFVTAWVGVYDRKTGTLDFVSAGHNPPLKVEGLKSGKVEELRSGKVEELGRVTWVTAPQCAALGAFETTRYRAAQTTLAPGDRLFLYTDGVTEAMNVRGELFGDDRLFAATEAAEGALLPTVEAAVRDYAEGAEQADDITMLELELT